ncbi:MAG: hypothetical protein HYX52_00260 [Chloroflexi bacterium]|nr:hypothetical protein [Chloroflexota bacterium]
MSAEAALVPALAGRRVLVAGDLVLDEYLTGRPSRVSREAPVLVLDESGREYRAGSAGSPAANVAALGSYPVFIGAVGGDAAAERILGDLKAHGVDVQGLVRAEAWETPTKTRILAEGFTGGLFGRQQVLRVDRVRPVPPDCAAACATAVQSHAANCEAVLLSDYRGGVVSPAVIAAARASGRPVCVDSQGDLRQFAGTHLVKVNHAEASAALGSADVAAGGDRLRRDLGIQALVVTLGADGMALFDEQHSGTLVPAGRQSDVFDVTGAGDTVIAVLTLCWLAHIPLLQAARIANAAASVVVRRLGVATVTPEELVAALHGA